MKNISVAVCVLLFTADLAFSQEEITRESKPLPAKELMASYRFPSTVPACLLYSLKKGSQPERKCYDELNGIRFSQKLSSVVRSLGNAPSSTFSGQTLYRENVGVLPEDAREFFNKCRVANELPKIERANCQKDSAESQIHF
jgi:hypothetical protein